jgi:2-amino-4-hydroxy-6-hydroxymethyldihydropteridine diphosphokinase
MTDVLVGLGSNMGHRLRHLSRAVHEIADLPNTDVVKVSHAYESEPWGLEEQEPFANAVALVTTTFRADQLLAAFQEIEERMGRERDVPNGPRPIDLDILLFGDEEWNTPGLTIPHPRMAERDFVMTPLLEVDPEAKWPDGKSVTRDEVSVGAVLGDLGPIPDPGLAEGQPITTDEWVVIAEGVTMPPDMGLRFKQLVLEQAQIPYTWDPFSPDNESESFGLSQPVRLRVPVGYEEKAIAVISEAEAAPEVEEAGEIGSGDDEDVPRLDWDLPE